MAAKVVSRTRRSRRERQREFPFTRGMISSLQGNEFGVLKDYRAKAWEYYSDLPTPTTKDEPWRRTDLRRLEADTFTLPTPEKCKNLKPIPDSLLRPLAGEDYGGQIALLPCDVSVKLSSDLADQGIIFGCQTQGGKICSFDRSFLPIRRAGLRSEGSSG